MGVVVGRCELCGAVGPWTAEVMPNRQQRLLAFGWREDHLLRDCPYSGRIGQVLGGPVEDVVKAPDGLSERPAPVAPTQRPARPLVAARALGERWVSTVLLPGRLVAPGAPTSLAVERPKHVGELAELVNPVVSCVLVPRSGFEWLGLPAGGAGQSHPFLELAAADGWRVSEQLGWYLRAQRDRSPAVAVVLLPFEPADYCAPWSTFDDDDRLIAGLAAFRRAVGAAWGPSYGLTAERLLLATHPRAKGGVALDPRPKLPNVMDQVGEIASLWRRPLTYATRPRFVHWFDANANYLSAYQVANLGFGEPTLHRTGLRALVEERYLAPGLWRADLSAEADVMPLPWSAESAWHTSPTIERARELGVDVTKLVKAAWVWPRASRFCEKFGAHMRDARTRLLDAHGVAGVEDALAASKLIYQRLHGRFGSAYHAKPGDPWGRPDWMQTIRAVARCNLDRRLRKLAETPFAVYVDSAYYLSDVEEPELYAEKIGLPIGPRSKLGAFHVAGSVAVTEELLERLDVAGSANAIASLLKHVSATGGLPDERIGPADAARYSGERDEHGDALLSEEMTAILDALTEATS